MKRRDFIGSSLSLATLTTAASVFKLRPANAQELELLQAGELSSATEGTFPPFSLRAPSGELDGFELRIMAEIAQRLGLSYRPSIVKWESILIGLQADQYDLVSNPMGITAERQKAVTFCDAWVESGARLVVPLDSPIQTPADAHGKTIGVIVASTFVPLAEKLDADIKTYKADPDALQDLVNGNIDAVITESIAAAYAIKTANLPLRLVDELLDSFQMGWAVKQGKPNLVRAINQALAAMIADGTYERIAMDMIGLNPAPRQPIRSIL
ncbi:MAG: transporter substrate-binding domain-containing protein [Candidatus Competibacteraceae bacterium]|nr:transporter substrate-binding domain-containing protein [Candidatus Competibacteraceae bacterium]MCB1815641.1 transporter substrate-binding domain-containing protein [Candidatus Competibacteraceae bacterium]